MRYLIVLIGIFVISCSGTGDDSTGNYPNYDSGGGFRDQTQKKSIGEPCLTGSECSSGACFDLIGYALQDSSSNFGTCSQDCTYNPCNGANTICKMVSDTKKMCYLSCKSVNDCYQGEDCLDNGCFRINGRIGPVDYHVILDIRSSGSWDFGSGAPDFHFSITDKNANILASGGTDDRMNIVFNADINNWYFQPLYLTLYDKDISDDDMVMDHKNVVEIFDAAYMLGGPMHKTYTYSGSDRAAEIKITVAKK